MSTIEWDQANAMQGGWGEDEIICRACTIAEMEAHGREEDGSLDVEAYLSNCHRGGFVPVLAHGVECEICGSEIE